MDIKKILALTIIALALFSCMSAASAGLFDFFGGGEVKNQTYTFDGFTLDFPETSNVTLTNNSKDGVDRAIYTIKLENKTSGTINSAVVVVFSGQNVVSSISEYVSNIIDRGGKEEGTYGEWTVLYMDGMSMLAKHTGSKLIVLRGSDLTVLKNLANTYKVK